MLFGGGGMRIGSEGKDMLVGEMIFQVFFSFVSL